MSKYIDEGMIFSLLESSKKEDPIQIKEIISKGKECKGLSLEDVAKLLYVNNADLLDELYGAAKHVKNIIYGDRVVIFAPLYTSNECINNCVYCGFRRDNKELHRKTLTMEEIVDEAKTMESMGHKRILLICGEHPEKSGAKHIANAMRNIYNNTGIKRINVEAAPMMIDGYKELKDAGIGTYVIFQETYSREVYKKMHVGGLKADFDWRITAHDRAFAAGIDDVGVGALFGLNDYKFEILALLLHAQGLEKSFGVGPHTISVPRLTPAFGWGLDKIPHYVNDDDFKKIVAIYRLAVPYTGIILSTRESPQIRNELLSIGVSQISAGSKTEPGGYKENDEKAGQFSVSDHRSLADMLEVICDSGYIPSFCTACYRKCRTGKIFMEYSKAGKIGDLCLPNAILTFKENLMDYGTTQLRQKGELVIKTALTKINNVTLLNETEKKLKQITEGERDLFF